MGITTSCKDPVAAIKYLDYLVGHQTLIQWGIKGKTYEVDKNGHYYRTKAEQAKFQDPDWVRNVFGRPYFLNYFPSLIGLDENGNSYMPDRQDNMIYGGSSASEKEVMDAYHVKSFAALFNDPRPISQVPYYPLWTITLKTGSPAEIESTRLSDALSKYIPKLVMSKPSEFDSIWKEYKGVADGLQQKQIAAYQKQIDWRMKHWANK
jgi:putative aldouronate transport system substrate-binding protein